MSKSLTSPSFTIHRARLWRWALAILGVGCFVLGIIGAIVPGMPTTVFLLIGSFCLTKSCPWLEERLLNIPVLRPYAQFVRSREPLSPRVRFVAIAMMSLSVAVSLALLFFAGRLKPVLGAFIGLLWLVGMVSILLFRRRR